MEENTGNSADGAIGAFLDSCYKGDQSAIASLLEKGVDVNDSDAVYTTALQVAAASGHETLVQLLVQRGARLDAANLYGWTPLMHAARHGHAGVVRLLLQRGADVRRCNRLGAPPLLLAAVSGHLSTVSALLEAGAGEPTPPQPPPPPPMCSPRPPPPPAVKPALGAAALTSPLGAGVRSGAPVAKAAKAAAAGRIARTPKPAAAGVATKAPGAAERPMKERRAPGPPPPMCTASALDPTVTATLAAAAHGNNSVLRLLLDRGAHLDTQLPQLGLTALMLAAVSGHRSTCRILLERGADPNAHNTLGQTALDMARVAGHRQVVRVLEEKTEETDDGIDGCDLHEAVRRRDLQLAAQLLTSGGGTANQLRPDGGAPLMLAALAGDTQMAALLLRHGAAVDLQDPCSGWTALMQAVFHNHPEMVKLLLSSGADANLRDHKGCTAFDLASLVDSSPDMIRLLAACTYKFTPPVPAAGLAGAGPAPLAWHSRAVSTPSLQDRGLKAWWSRFSARFQNPKSRVEPVVMTSVRPIPEETAGPESAGRLGPELTLDNILPPAKRVAARMPQGFPARSLPSDTLRTVVPPFCSDRRTEDRCCLPPALNTEPHWEGSPDSAAAPGAGAGAASGGHLNTYRLLSYLRSPNSSPSNSLGQRRLLSPGPHSSGDSGFETSGKSSADHLYFNKAAKASPVKRGSNKNKQKLSKKSSGSSGDPPTAAAASAAAAAAAASCASRGQGSDCQGVGKVTYLLRSLGLARYGPAFSAQEVDFEAFLDLTEADLQELEVSRRDRHKLGVVIRELREKLRV